MGKDLKELIEDWLNSHFTFEGISTALLSIKKPRESNLLYLIAERTPYGYDGLILQALRIRLRYPLGCRDIDAYIDRLLFDRKYGQMYYFTDLYFDPGALTIRR